MQHKPPGLCHSKEISEEKQNFHVGTSPSDVKNWQQVLILNEIINFKCVTLVLLLVFLHIIKGTIYT